jgi:predicted acylesterase/phospholipase RssA
MGSATAGRETRRREIRAGLVMYGGVSLATYTYGVSREFHDAVRGRGVYGLLKALTDSDFVVDVVSGTSAGGINGVLLSYCLANGYEFGAFADLWRERGALSKLVVRRRDLDGTNGILDGDYFLGQLRAALDEVKTRMLPPLGPEDSPIAEMDLFVTATDARGRIQTWFDDAGHAVDVKDHRVVFKLKYRRDRYSDLAPGHSRALAKLARATASFPAAFPPCRVGADPEDEVLRLWGKLPADEIVDLMDGGVLDNKPFTYTLDAIFFRHAFRDVKRVLFYVEPDPERFAQGDAKKPGPETPRPTAFESAVKGLTGIPSYESIAEDLRALTMHNDAVTRRARIHGVAAVADDGGGCPPTLTTLHRRLRLGMLADRVLHGMLLDRGEGRHFTNPEERAAIGRLSRDFWRYFDGQPKEVEALLGRFDIYFRLRRLFHVLYSARVEDRHSGWYQALVGLVSVHEIVRWGMESVIDERASMVFRNRVPATPEAPRILLDTGHLWTAAEASLGWFLEGILDAVHAAVLACRDPLGAETARKALHVEVVAAIRSARERAASDVPEVVPAMALPGDALGRLDHAVLELATEAGLAAAAAGFDCVDALDLVESGHARLPSRDVIRAVRLSPYDAKLGYSRDVPPAGKISGDSLFHFGGFLKRAWRSNDILWGRIDGSAQVIEDFMGDGVPREAADGTVVPAHLDTVLSDADVRAALRRRLADPADPLWLEGLFARGAATAPLHVRAAAGQPRNAPRGADDCTLAEWLDGLLSDDAPVRALAIARWPQGLEALALAHHRSTVACAAEQILEDQIAEEMEWGGRRGARLAMWWVGLGSDASLPVKLSFARSLVRSDVVAMGIRPTAPASGAGSHFPMEVADVVRLDAAVGRTLNIGAQTVRDALTLSAGASLLSRIGQAAMYAAANSCGRARGAVRGSGVFRWGDRILSTLPLLVAPTLFGAILRIALVFFVAASAAVVFFGPRQPTGFGKGAMVTGLALAALWLFARLVPRWLFPAALSVALVVVTWSVLCGIDVFPEGLCGPVCWFRDWLALAVHRLDAALTPP